jgi:hypothetical protein
MGTKSVKSSFVHPVSERVQVEITCRTGQRTEFPQLDVLLVSVDNKKITKSIPSMSNFPVPPLKYDVHMYAYFATEAPKDLRVQICDSPKVSCTFTEQLKTEGRSKANAEVADFTPFSQVSCTKCQRPCKGH